MEIASFATLVDLAAQRTGCIYLYYIIYNIKLLMHYTVLSTHSDMYTLYYTGFLITVLLDLARKAACFSLLVPTLNLCGMVSII